MNAIILLKFFLLNLCLFTCSILLQAQDLDFDPKLKPFYHGVASGDPLSDRVIIWTRVTPEDEFTKRTIPVSWKMATDVGLQNVVASGNTVTDRELDFTVKLDVGGLSPATTYYYQFEALGAKSIIGRTRTTPSAMVEKLRFAVVSCNNYQHGYFTGFEKIAERADLDAVIHLGDYIYEYGPLGYGNNALIASGERDHVPAKEVVDLEDYRIRYSQYRLDPDLRRAHQQHPFITVWDDHESANDAYEDGAENHQPEEEGPWEVRKSVSKKVYSEWMPVRGDLNSIPLYRTIQYGELMDLIMLDTRLEDRVKQGMDVTSAELYDETQTMLGTSQKEWLYEQLLSSQAKWKVIGNQVIFSPFNVWWAGLDPDGDFTPLQLESLFLDIWDGYPSERDEIIQFIQSNALENMVILTGDFHSSLAFDVTAQPSSLSGNDPGIVAAQQVPVPVQPTYDPASGTGAVAVEFATPSITSANFDENIGAEAAIGFEFQINRPLPEGIPQVGGINPNPHLKFNDLDEHGYYILDVQEDRVQANWYFLEDILTPESNEFFAAAWGTDKGISRLTEGQESLAKADPPPLAPDVSESQKNFVLQILHASDLEGGVDALDNAPNFAALADKLEDSYDNTLILSGGDNYIPGPFYGAAGDRALRPVFQDIYQTIFNETGLNNIREGAGRADITIMNIIGFDASAVGNHEFDAGTNAFADIIDTDIRGGSLGDVRWLGAQFPYLSANLNFLGDVNLEGLYTSDLLSIEAFSSSPAILEEEANAPKIAPASIAELNGERVGIVGASTQLLASLSSEGGVTVEGPDTEDMSALAEVLQPTVDALSAEGINKIVLVTHLQQIALEKELITLLNDVDIVIAGGSDVLFAQEDDLLRAGDIAEEPYPFITQNAGGEPAVIVGTDGEYSYLSRLIVEFDENGVLQENSLTNMLSGAFATTPEVVREIWQTEDPFAVNSKGDLVRRLTQALEEIVNAQDANILGLTEVYLDGRREQVRTEETNLGNLTADANLYVARMFDPAVAVSIKNGGGIRASIGEILDLGEGRAAFLPPQPNPETGKAEGEISQLDISNSLRFNNGLTLLTLSTADLKAVLEHAVSASTPGSTPGQFPQIAGIQFSYDTTREAGMRVVSIGLLNEEGAVKDQLLDNGEFTGNSEEEIRIVTLNFLAGGGDNYPFPDLATDRVDLPEQGLPEGNASFAAAGTEQDALAEYLLAEVSQNAFSSEETPVQEDDRIILLNAQEPVNQLAVTSFVLVNARSDQDIQPLEDGDVLALSELPRVHLNVRAEVNGKVKSVQFLLNGEQQRVENIPPYALFGDTAGDYESGRLRPGSYTIEAIPYSESGAKGIAGVSLKISFEVVRRYTIADVVRRTPTFSSLLAALKRAGLLSALVGEGPYTVFAPTDPAFARLLDDLGVNNPRQISVRDLQRILQLHVVPRSLMAADLSDQQRLETLLGEDIFITLDNGEAFVNGIRIVQNDIVATNGIVHVVEEVLLPDDGQNELILIPELVSSNAELSILNEALEQTGLSSRLAEEGPFTLFAPSNEAFIEVLSLLGIADLNKIPDFLLKKLLMYHVVNGSLSEDDLSENPFITSLTGLPLTVGYYNQTLFINNADVKKTDLMASNGMVHIMVDVILPDLNALLLGLEELFSATEALEDSRISEMSPKEVPIQILAIPNPGASEVRIISNGNKGQRLVVNVMNSQGLSNRMQNFDLLSDQEEIVIDMNSFPKGVYIVHAQLGQIEKYIRVVR